MNDRLLVNLLWLVPGRVGGSEESVTTMLRAVADEVVPGEFPDVHLALTPAVQAAHPDLAERFEVHVVDLDARSKPRRVVAEQTVLARTARQLGAEVVHHAGGIVPLAHPGRVVLTVHDLQPLDLPGNFTATKRTYVRAMVGRSARVAQVVCVPSEFTRGRVVDLLKVPQDRVVVVPWAAPPVPQLPGHASPLPAVRADDGRPDPDLDDHVPTRPYFLWPAITYPHKNHQVLLAAFAELVGGGADVELVLAGGLGPSEGDVISTVVKLGLTDRVRRTGRVPAPLLDRLYRSAAAVVVPSRYEGFGLPVVEAQVRGCPVVVADAGSLPEVADPSDLQDPDDVAGWAAAMRDVLQMTQTERRARTDRGLALAAAFTPSRTAVAQLDAYRQARG
jgi:glycosyltransferase involved in cell wall biosynthesis